MSTLVERLTEAERKQKADALAMRRAEFDEVFKRIGPRFRRVFNDGARWVDVPNRSPAHAAWRRSYGRRWKLAALTIVSWFGGIIYFCCRTGASEEAQKALGGFGAIGLFIPLYFIVATGRDYSWWEKESTLRVLVEDKCFTWGQNDRPLEVCRAGMFDADDVEAACEAKLAERESELVKRAPADVLLALLDDPDEKDPS